MVTDRLGQCVINFFLARKLDNSFAPSKETRSKIGHRLDQLQTDLTGDVKKLTASGGKYRLRVGSFRVLFTLQQDTIFVYAVKDRKEAYD